MDIRANEEKEGGMQAIQRREGLDRDRIDVVVDDGATRMQTDDRNGYGNHKTTITHNLGVAVERGPAITIIKWAMALGRQQGAGLWP